MLGRRKFRRRVVSMWRLAPWTARGASGQGRTLVASNGAEAWDARAYRRAGHVTSFDQNCSRKNEPAGQVFVVSRMD